MMARIACGGKNKIIPSYADKSILDDKELLLQMVWFESKFFQFASERLRDDKELAMVTFDHDISQLQYAGERLQNKLLHLDYVES